MKIPSIKNNIQIASRVVGTTWPLYSFVTSNPLSGFENLSFAKACQQVYKQNGILAYPEVVFFNKALENDLIDEVQIQEILIKNNFQGSKATFFAKINNLKSKAKPNPSYKVDQILVKWLSAFLDEGLADWQMPNQEKGFYKAWKELAKYDNSIQIPKEYSLPDSSLEAIESLVKNYTEEEQIEIFEHHFAALPGWVGYIKYRIDYTSEWQKYYPLEFEDYLAVRLLVTHFLGLDLASLSATSAEANQLLSILHHCLSTVEEGWQEKLASKLVGMKPSKLNTAKAEVQLVFCIDTRSELIRRNIEDKGNYETYGYAGFFGIAMDYEVPYTNIKRKSCPPIVPSAYRVSEKNENKSKIKSLQTSFQQKSFKKYFLNRMKNILPSAFGFVEGAGLIYGFQLLKRTFVNGTNKTNTNEASIESTCSTHIHQASNGEELNIEEQSLIVKSAFDLTGWYSFAPIIVFAGHGSHSTNNPFASSLDCGACAASPGRHNARMLAQLANDKKVRQHLAIKHQIEIPESTLFLGAEHNTTTDEIILFDADAPKEFHAQINSLKVTLKKAQQTATKERLGGENSVEFAFKKSLDWSETRPEWGLAKNAGFIIGPRSKTQNLNLEGQCFLHSYDYKKDPNGVALNGILNGPMVVTQWINNHYYFSTVDNNHYGSGSKITHNIVGKFGVVQGNGGDLKTGLPLQSVNQTDNENYHQPQRLSVFIYAPKEMVSKLLIENPHLKQLIENQWIHLLVIDPNQENKPIKYNTNGNWHVVKRKEVLA